MNDLKHDISWSSRLKCNRAARLLIYDSLLVVNSICADSIYILGFNFSKSRKGRCNGAGGRPIYEFFLVFISNMARAYLVLHMRYNSLRLTPLFPTLDLYHMLYS